LFKDIFNYTLNKKMLSIYAYVNTLNRYNFIV